MQMWTLARFLPLLIANYIADDDHHWLNFLRLLEITDILFSRKITVQDCAYLETLISDHHIEFQELYPAHKITPKLHAMIHMPRLMLE